MTDIQEMIKNKDWEKLVETILAGFQQLDEDLKEGESKNPQLTKATLQNPSK